MFQNKEVKWLLSCFLSSYIDTTIGEITHLEREREERVLVIYTPPNRRTPNLPREREKGRKGPTPMRHQRTPNPPKRNKGRAMITKEKKKLPKKKGMTNPCKKRQQKRITGAIQFKKESKGEHITNVDKEHDDDDDDEANAHNLINAEKKRKILFFIIRIDL